MAVFLGSLSFIVQIFVLCYGLILLSRRYDKTLNAGDRTVDYYNLAGWILVIFGIIGAVWVGAYVIDYWVHGFFEAPYPEFLRGARIP